MGHANLQAVPAEPSVQDPRRSGFPGAPPSVARPAVGGGSRPLALNVLDHYCAECFAPCADDYCERHAHLGVKRCEFCDDVAIVNDLGVLHCLKDECIRKAGER